MKPKAPEAYFKSESGIEPKVIMAPPHCGAGLSIVIPNLIQDEAKQHTKNLSPARAVRGYSKPNPWPSK